eukprot:CAMPEP_0205914580 /NCGR_PEP_ID=MMETSP1325-20131115/7313_1 /ASSEMBLY_ACC=CAM_ASM_000708 /TAXON_ID=236786 /ORGANISM="Florenciella sp., Strain RCC1007" /LENGTH=60 /DNA_ID=CAMNT_0053281635 /DNA_START=90 /DNA_END=269 /DNA_ORIENTATION=+
MKTTKSTDPTVFVVDHVTVVRWEDLAQKTTLRDRHRLDQVLPVMREEKELPRLGIRGELE